MNAICIKSTTKLIKGATYKVVYFNNSNGNKSSYFRPIIRIRLNDNNIQTFNLGNFQPTTGTSFPSTTWICPEYQSQMSEVQQTKIDNNIKAGDYVVPLYDNLKTLVKGRKYKITEVNTTTHRTWTTIKLKLEGSDRLYNSYNFRKCTAQESREIGLSQLFDEQVDTVKVNKYKRKFDYYSDDEKIKLLLQFICESANDRFRHQMDIIDWAISKTSIKYKLNREDFSSIMNLNISQILDVLK